MLVEPLYTDEGGVHLVVWRWGSTKPEVVKDFLPYFFIPDDGDEPVHPKILFSESGFISIDGRVMRKLTVPSPSDVKDIRDDFEHHEADIPFPQRYLIDLERMDEGRPHILYLDIEVGSDGPTIPDAYTADRPILCLSTWSDKNKRFVCFIHHHGVSKTFRKSLEYNRKKCNIYWFPNEKDMLVEFVKFWRDVNPEIITAWNVHDFDMKYIMRRLQRFGIDVRYLSPMRETSCEPEGDVVIRGRVVFDLYAAYTKYKDRSEDDNSLGAAAQRELGRSKADEGLDKTRMLNEWIKNPEKVLSYNVEDVNLMVDLDDRLGVIPMFLEIHKETHIQMADTLNYGTAVEYFTKRFTGKVIGSRQGKEESFEGAEVFEVKKGIHKWVMSFDVIGMYPSSMENCNMGPDTIMIDPEVSDGLIDTGGGVYFKPHSHGLGVYAKVCHELRRLKDKYGVERMKCEYGTDEYKVADNKRTMWKKLLNSVYGSTGSGGRLGNTKIAASVTRVSRKAIIRARGVADKMGLEVPGGHTDSVHVKADTDDLRQILNMGDYLETAFNIEYVAMAKEMGIVETDTYRWVMEFAQVSQAAFWAGKTRYGLWLRWVEGKEVDKFQVKGFDAIRSDTSSLGRELQEYVIYEALKGKGMQEISAHVAERLNDTLDDKDFAAFAVPKRIRRPFNTYGPKAGGMRPWVEGCRFANKHLGTRHKAGVQAKMLVISKVRGLPDTPSICFSDPNEVKDVIDTKLFVDWAEMKRKVVAKVAMVYDPLGWPIANIDGQRSLDMWMGMK